MPGIGYSPREIAELQERQSDWRAKQLAQQQEDAVRHESVLDKAEARFEREDRAAAELRDRVAKMGGREYEVYKEQLKREPPKPKPPEGEAILRQEVRIRRERREESERHQQERRDGTLRKRAGWGQAQQRIHDRREAARHENDVRHRQADAEAQERYETEIAALGPQP
jgi:hypothetical protein